MLQTIKLPHDLKISTVEFFNLRDEYPQFTEWVEIHFYYPHSEMYCINTVPVSVFEIVKKTRGSDYFKYVRKIVYLMDAENETETETK